MQISFNYFEAESLSYIPCGCELPTDTWKSIRHSRSLQSIILVIFGQLKHLHCIHNHQLNKENNSTQQNNTKRQPSSRGSPRPRGYIHNLFVLFISLSKNRPLTKITAHSWPVLPYLTADLWIQTLSFQTMHKSSLFQHKFVCLNHPGSV